MKKIRVWKKTISVIATLALLFNSLAAPLTVLAQETPSPEPTSTPTESPAPVETSTPTPEVSIEPTSTPTSTPDASPTEIATPTPSATPEATEAATPTPSDQPVETQAPESTPTVQGPPSESNQPTPTSTQTPTPTFTPIETPEDASVTTTVVETSVIPETVQENNWFKLITDKLDYAPDEMAIITGSDFEPNKTYSLTVSSTDDPATSTTVDITTDANGGFTFYYQLDGTYRPNYKVDVKDLEVVVASTTFLDHSNMSVNINDGDSTTDTLAVTLNLSWGGSGGDPTQARYANDTTTWNSCNDGLGSGSWTAWETLTDAGGNTATKLWSLASGSEGERKVCVQTAHGSLGSPSASQSDNDEIDYELEPDLVISKANNVGDSVNFGNTFTWTLTITNSGSGNAVFYDNEDIIQDNLPQSPSYSGLFDSYLGGISGDIDCGISGDELKCEADGTVTIHPGGSYSVTFTVTPSEIGTLNNPSGWWEHGWWWWSWDWRDGICKVDPDNEVDESNGGNNSCSNSVNVVEVSTGSIQVNKLTDTNGDGEFETGYTASNDIGFRWGIDSETPERLMGSTATALPTGNYNIAENDVSGYHFVGWFYGNEDYGCEELDGTEFPTGINVSSDSTTYITLCNSRDTGTVTVTKFNDLDQDGWWDQGDGEGEPTLSGWEIVLGETTQTTIDGQTTFSNVVTDTYTLNEILQNGWVQTNISCDQMTETLVRFMEEDDDDGYYELSVHAGENINCYIGNFQEDPKLKIEKGNDKPDGITPGSLVTYNVTLSNTGNIDVNGATITDVLPGGFTYLAGSTTGAVTTDPTILGSVLTWEIGTLAAGESKTITYQTLTASDLADGTYTNFASCKAFKNLEEFRRSNLESNSIECDPSSSSNIRIGKGVSFGGSLTGQVLGASTELPATGNPTALLVVALAALGIGLFMKGYTGKVKKSKKTTRKMVKSAKKSTKKSKAKKSRKVIKKTKKHAKK